MIEFVFDARLFTSIRVKAESEAEARATLKGLLDAATVTAGAWPDGSPAVFEASIEGEADLMETHPDDGGRA